MKAEMLERLDKLHDTRVKAFGIMNEISNSPNLSMAYFEDALREINLTDWPGVGEKPTEDSMMLAAKLIHKQLNALNQLFIAAYATQNDKKMFTYTQRAAETVQSWMDKCPLRKRATGDKVLIAAFSSSVKNKIPRIFHNPFENPTMYLVVPSKFIFIDLIKAGPAQQTYLETMWQGMLSLLGSPHVEFIPRYNKEIDHKWIAMVCYRKYSKLGRTGAL